MAPVIVKFEDLNDDDKMEVFTNPNIQSLCLQFKGRCKRVQDENGLNNDDESLIAVGIAKELMEYLPFNSLEVTEEDGTTRDTNSPCEIAFTLAYYMKKAGIIP